LFGTVANGLMFWDLIDCIWF